MAPTPLSLKTRGGGGGGWGVSHTRTGPGRPPVSPTPHHPKDPGVRQGRKSVCWGGVKGEENVPVGTSRGMFELGLRVGGLPIRRNSETDMRNTVQYSNDCAEWIAAKAMHTRHRATKIV